VRAESRGEYISKLASSISSKLVSISNCQSCTVPQSKEPLEKAMEISEEQN
jgi:hypothetical protein